MSIGINDAMNRFASGNNYFVMRSGYISASGNLSSLLDGEGVLDNIENEYAFSYLFYNCKNLKKLPNS